MFSIRVLGFIVWQSIENFFDSLSISAMAKNRAKKKRGGAVSMDVTEPTVSDIPQGTEIFFLFSQFGKLKQDFILLDFILFHSFHLHFFWVFNLNFYIFIAAMDTSESGALKPVSGMLNM